MWLVGWIDEWMILVNGESLNGWLTDWMNDGSINRWKYRWMNDFNEWWIDERMTKWMIDQLMDGWKDGWMDGWWMDACMNEWTHAWMNEMMMDGRMDRWLIYERMNQVNEWVLKINDEIKEIIWLWRMISEMHGWSWSSEITMMWIKGIYESRCDY